MAWRDVHVGKRNDRVRIGGVEIWREEWRWIDGRTVHLPHPLLGGPPQRFMICEVGSARNPVRFAAAEMPDGLWAFYVPDQAKRNDDIG